MKFLTAILLMVVFAVVPANTTDFYPENQAIRYITSALKVKNILLTEMATPEFNRLKNQPVTLYKVTVSNQKDFFYAVFTQAKGRYDYFDYLVITNDDFVIKKVDVLKYRSEHGGEIGSKKWLEQFENYSGGKLDYSEEISTLSGATFSAMSITRDIQTVIDVLKKSFK